MKTVERGIEVQVPASTAYDAWTRFERFPEFMEDVTQVVQKDERRLRWRANLWGKTEEWDAVITEQIPDKRIAWTSEAGARNGGCVTFHRLTDDTSRVMLQLAYEPEGLGEKVADALGLVTRRIERDLESFKQFVEREGARVAGRRSEIAAKPDAAQKHP